MIAPGIPCFATSAGMLGPAQLPRISPRHLRGAGFQALHSGGALPPRTAAACDGGLSRTFGAPSRTLGSHAKLAMAEDASAGGSLAPVRGPVRLRALLTGTVWRYLAATLSLATLFVANSALAATVPAAAVAGGAGPLAWLSRALHFVLHLDKELVDLVAKYGTTTYAVLWGIVFAETGLVVTPFLPGDSLLFACGALAALNVLNLWTTMAVFITAAILGDAVNYFIGSKVGKKAFEADSWFLKRKNLRKTEEFYEKYGGKTIVLARFVPIVRTFAPFVAGIGEMDYNKFALYNVFGAFLWTFLFTGAGFFFGNFPAVKHNFTLVVLAIVAVSVLPVIWEIWQARKEGAEGK